MTPQIMKIHWRVEAWSCASWTTMRSIVSLTWKLKSCEFRTRPKPSRNKNTPRIATKSQRLTCMPGSSQRDMRCSELRPSPLNIAVLHERLDVLASQVRRELVREKDGTVASARAADADREMRFALL